MDQFQEHERHPEQERHPGGLDERDDFELLDDRTSRISAGRLGRRSSVSFPGAVAGAFLVTALAFGAAITPGGAAMKDDATAGRTDAAGAGGGTVAHADQSILGYGAGDWLGDWSKDRPAGEDAKPGSDEIDKHPEGDKPDGDKPGDEPTEKPDPTPDGKPDVEAMRLVVSLDGTKVVVDWTACYPEGFGYYKVVRSTNEGVTWPLGSGDTLIGAFEDIKKTVMVDAKAPAGKKLFYRVFAVVEHEGKLVAACASPTRGIATKPASDGPSDGKTLAIELGIVEGHPKIRFGECPADFDYYKVVRSTDATVSWPAGANDKVVGVVGPDGDRKVYDGDAPAGKKLFYRVFCVRTTESGYAIVAASAVKSIVTPTGEPKPEAYVLGIEIAQGEGSVVIDWEACTSDGFQYYKVVRSMTNSKPNYPANDGTQVIAAISNHATTHFVDSDVAPGQTWYYRVVSIGKWNGQTVTLGYTPVASLTVQ